MQLLMHCACSVGAAGALQCALGSQILHLGAFAADADNLNNQAPSTLGGVTQHGTIG